MSQLENKAPAMIGGGILAGAIASICCVGPVVLTLLGVSGAATLAKFEFLRLPMIVVVAVVFIVAGRSLLKKKTSCEPGSICADPKKYKMMVIAYWVGLALAIGGITSIYWINWLF
ncbi:MAG: mercuric transporter MerT family protein [Oligoflexus sp.]